MLSSCTCYVWASCLGALGKVNTLLDLGNELGHHGLETSLLVVRQVTQAMHLLNTFSAQLNLGGEEWCIGHSGLDVCALSCGLTVQAAQAGVSKQGSGVGHGQSGRALASLGLHNLSATVLSPLGQSVQLLSTQGNLGCCLREQRQNGDASMATNHRHVHGGNIQALLLGVEGLRTHHIQGGNTQNLALVIDTHLLQGLGSDGNSGIDGVGNNVQHSPRAVLAASSNQVPYNASVDLEQIITGHARLPGNTSWNDDKISTPESISQVVLLVALDLSLGVDVADIGSNARSATNIVQRKRCNLLVHLHQQR
mmetsp:Transcript_14046/g.30414  ORF Transcript_14046/g.30414 Transcript_14046/m.30414 type:complete len:310 (-) Transcript_14046:238-1167(-)